MVRILFTLLVGSVLTNPAWAIFKCTGADGKAVYQDTVCEGGGRVVVRPGSGNAPAAAPAGEVGTSQTAKKPQTEAQRIEAQIAKSQRERRITEIEVRLLPDAKGAVFYGRAQCDAAFASLKDKKVLAKNNLAGATWEQSISTEMAAIAARCDTESRRQQDDVDRLEKELVELRTANKG